MSKSGGFSIFKWMIYASILFSLIGYSFKCEGDKVSFNKKHGSGCIFNKR